MSTKNLTTPTRADLAERFPVLFAKEAEPPSEGTCPVCAHDAHEMDGHQTWRRRAGLLHLHLDGLEYDCRPLTAERLLAIIMEEEA